MRAVNKPKIKKDDTVMVIAGKDKGKTGRVLKVDPAKGKILVEGLNKYKKHMRRVSDEMPGGILEIEMPMDISNVQILCSGCNRPVRVAIKEDANGGKSRVCKKCGTVI